MKAVYQKEDDVTTVSSFDKVQQLYQAAREAVDSAGNDMAPSKQAVADLAAAVKAMEEAAKESDKLAHVREVAREDEVEPSCDCGEQGESTYCGTMCQECFLRHCEECEVCRTDGGPF